MISKLKLITEEKIGFSITNLNDSKRLSEIILLTTDLSLNYNTIRRFFGIVKSVKASNYTLDTLAKFNGYKDYNDFLINCELQNKWKTELIVIDLIHSDENNKLLNIIKKKLHSEKGFYLKFIQIVRELLLVKNFGLLIKIFKLEKVQPKHFVFDNTLLIGLSIGKLLKQINYKDSEFEKLLLIESFQDLIISINVDYFNLNNYYGHAIKIIYKHSKRKNTLEFCKGILNVSNYLNNNKDLFNLNYDDSFHPILKSRVYAQFILKDDKNVINKLNQYYNLIKNKDLVPIEYFFEIIFSSILTKNFKVMGWIVEKVSNKKGYKYFYKFEHYQNFLFMKLLFDRKNSDFLSINNTLEHFNFTDFNRSYKGIIDQFIYIFKFHTSNFNDKKKYLNLYLKNSKENGLDFFTKKYIVTYFEE